MKPGPASPFGPYWLSRDVALDGAMTYAPVINGDTDAAARLLGMRSAKECKR